MSTADAISSPVCEFCLREDFEQPAVEKLDDHDVCRRHANLLRSNKAAVGVSVSPPVAAHSEPRPHDGAQAIAAPVKMSKNDYLEKYGPATQDDLLESVRNLAAGEIMLIPTTKSEIPAAVKRYRRLFGKSGYKVEGRQEHSHVYVERLSS